MYIVTFLDRFVCQYLKSAGSHTVHFEPMKQYLLTNEQFFKLNDGQRSLIFRSSPAEPRFKNFSVSGKRGGEHRGKLLFWIGAGGYGDQIMALPIPMILNRLGYEVHVATDPGNFPIWTGFDWASSIFQFPDYYARVKMFDHHCLLESVTNSDEHLDQEHPVDMMLRRIGLDPNDVDPSLKVVRPVFSNAEIGWARGRAGGRNVGIYQLGASGKVRSLSPEKSSEVLGALADEYPDTTWYAIVDQFMDYSYRLKAEALGRKNVVVEEFKDIRLLMALTSISALVVAPDSMMVHVAGSMGIPCVGLWGSTSPDSRICYYSNHTPIWHTSQCPATPCYRHRNEFPAFCPTGKEQKCAVVSSISVDDVLKAAKLVSRK